MNDDQAIPRKRAFAAYFYFTGWDHISLGVHACLKLPNIEIHVPFGFFRIGMVLVYGDMPVGHKFAESRTFGIRPEW